MELPLEDLELVNALQIAPRASWSELGAALGRHPTTLANRWDRLRGRGLAWVTGHLAGGPDQSCLAFVGVECDPRNVAETARLLCSIPEVITVDEATRSWDLRLTTLTADWHGLASGVLPAIRAVPGVLRTQLMLCTRLYALGNNWRLDVLGGAQQRRLNALRPTTTAPPRHPPTHFAAMLPLLNRNGRATAADLAHDLGIHPSTAGRQLKSAVASGLLTFRCELAQDYSGYPISCQWYVRVPPASLEAAVDFLRHYRTLRLCAAISGDANFTFYLWLRTPADIAEVEEKLQAAVPAVTIMESSVGVRTYKRLGWILRVDSGSTGEVVV